MSPSLERSHGPEQGRTGGALHAISVSIASNHGVCYTYSLGMGVPLMRYLATIHAGHCPLRICRGYSYENVVYFRMLSAVVWWVVASLTRVVNDSGIPSARGIYSKKGSQVCGTSTAIYWFKLIPRHPPAVMTPYSRKSAMRMQVDMVLIYVQCLYMKTDFNSKFHHQWVSIR